MSFMKLVWPTMEGLLDYVAALKRDWAQGDMYSRQAAQKALGKIATDSVAFIASLVDHSVIDK